MSATHHDTDAWDEHAVHHLAIEHAMRLTGDEATVACIAAAVRPTDRLVALGMLLGQLDGDLPVTDSPLYAWARSRPVRADWRRWCDPAPDSLFATLEWLRTLLGVQPVVGCSPLVELVELRHALSASVIPPTAPPPGRR
jgi:hypothetical protein